MRAFIIGTGPSIQSVDFNQLQAEYCFTTGRIHLLLRDFDFTPAVHVITESSVNPYFPEDRQYHLAQSYELIVMAELLPKSIYDDWTRKPNITPYGMCPHTVHHPPDAWHFPYLCKQGGAVPVAIQAAVMRGFEEIYLLGCDGNFRATDAHSGNYFHTDYNISFGSQFAEERNQSLMLAHTLAAKECAERGVSIYNLSPDSMFDMYEKKTLTEVLEEKS
nr:hypothetical protein [Anaerolineae bacterium]